MESSLAEVLDLYSWLALGLTDHAATTFVTTQSDHMIYEDSGLSRYFDDYQRLTTAADLVRSVTQSTLVVTERLHPAILAAANGIPFIYLQTTSKSRDLQRLLNDYVPDGIIDDCFIDMSSSLESLKPSCKSVTGISELPPALFAASQAIQKRLLTAAGQLAHKLCRADGSPF